MSIQYGGDKITFADGSTVASGWSGFKNRIINGAMMIDQRNAGASVSVSTPAYTLDRWAAYLLSGSGHTVQQVSDAPTGFSNSLKITVGTGASPSSTQQNILWQNIEGYNCSDLGLGTANAATVTVSFNVKSSVSGTFNLWLQSGSGTIRAYPTTFTVNSTGTWESKTVTVTLDTSAVGTWSKTNGSGLLVGYSLGCGSNFVSTANTWQTGDYKATSGAVSVIATSGATFQVTGVQLEKGSTATSFDYRPYGTELSLAQRYYEVGGGVTEASPAAATMFPTYYFKVTKRAGATVTNSRSVTIGGWDTQVSGWYQNSPDSAANIMTWTASAEL